MVAKLSLPELNSIDIVNNIIDSRVQFSDFFDSIKDDLIRQLLSYQQNGGDPCLISPLELSIHISQKRVDVEHVKKPRKRESEDALERLTHRRKKSLIGLYQPGADNELHDILENLRDNHGLLFCPCCGEPGKPGTLDHYLPKSIYPELSVMVENLTPMCTDCQELKGNEVKDGNGNKVYIHPYYDPIEQVLFDLEITPPYKSPSSFIIKVPLTVAEPFKSIVKRHIKEINLEQRFEEFCSIEYSDLLSTLAEEREDEDRETVIKTFNRFLRKAKKRSPNRWEAIFYRGILSNQNLLDYLENADLSEYLEEA